MKTIDDALEVRARVLGALEMAETADDADARVLLFDGGKQILTSFGDRLAARATAELGRLGVEVNCERTITSVDELGVDVKAPDGATERIAARTKVWAAGVQASPLDALLAKGSGAGIDRWPRGGPS
jgi:NADH dehydrogenase